MSMLTLSQQFRYTPSNLLSHLIGTGSVDRQASNLLTTFRTCARVTDRKSLLQKYSVRLMPGCPLIQWTLTISPLDTAETAPQIGWAVAATRHFLGTLGGNTSGLFSDEVTNCTPRLCPDALTTSFIVCNRQRISISLAAVVFSRDFPDSASVIQWFIVFESVINTRFFIFQAKARLTPLSTSSNSA